MRRSKIQVAVPSDDKFYLEDTGNSFTVFIIGLKNLQSFIRKNTPQGIKVRSKRWFAKRINKHSSLELTHPLFNTAMFDICETGWTPENKDFKNGQILLPIKTESHVGTH
jgi:hypothetical protein